MVQIENLIDQSNSVSLFNLLACIIHGLSPENIRKMISDLRACAESKVKQDIERFGIFYEDMYKSF